jgi:Spy/CpxP family protein refolding chaperone
MNMQTRNTLLLAALFGVGLLTGGVLGAAITKHSLLQPPRPGPLASRIEQELVQKLDLTSAQQQKAHLLVQNSMQKIMVVYSQTIRKIDAELLDAQRKLTSELTPEQRAKLSDLAKDRQEFLRKYAPMAPTGMP